MKNDLIKYVKAEVNKLKYTGDSVNLNNVYPYLLENILDFDFYELNGYDCDYFVTTDKYEISGSMRFGTANIILIKGEQKPKNNFKDKKEIVENKLPEIIKLKDLNEAPHGLKTFYFTFGYNQKYEGYVQPIMAKHCVIARNKMFEINGPHFASQYDETEWKKVSMFYVDKYLDTIVILEKEK